MNYDSIAERDAEASIAALGGTHCTSFEPLLSKHYRDADGAEAVGKPDFVIKRSRCFTFVDTKAGKLNFCVSQADSHDALKRAYRRYFGRSGDHLSHWQLSGELFKQGQLGVREALKHSWNHSLFKLLALQAKHGWQRFLVVFKNAPTKADAETYIEHGLVFCTLKTLPQMMTTIELLQHGWLIPFVFKAKDYSFTVTPDAASHGLTPAQVEEMDRDRFLAAAFT